MNRYLSRHPLAAAALGALAAALVAYGLILLRPGFFWDDWQVVYLAQSARPADWWNYFLSDRPLSIWTHLLALPVLGLNALAWQVYALALRLAAIVLACAALLELWPERRREVFWVAVLLSVFPAFTQQPIALSYSQHFITAALCAASFALMARAARRGQPWLHLPGALAALLSLATMEYFAGLELLRPLALWLALRQPGQPRRRAFKSALLAWLPYAAAALAFAVWRFGVYPALLAAPDPNAASWLAQLRAEPITALAWLMQAGLQDTLHLLFFSWSATFAPESIVIGPKTVLAAWAAGAALAAGVYWLAGRLPAPRADDDRFLTHAGLAGALALIGGMLPVWVTQRQVIVGLWSDRFSLGGAFGAALLVVVGVSALIERPWLRAALLAALAGLAAAAQARAVADYTDHWRLARDYAWQLVWRAPNLAPGSAVLGPGLPYSFTSDYGLAFELNTLYFPESVTPGVWFFNAGREWRGQAFETLAGAPLKGELRDLTFAGNTDQAIAVTYNPARGCLRVLDSAYAGAPALTENDRDLWVLSHPERVIQTNDAQAAAARAAALFGSAPTGTWCEYFQKGDLARQSQDWQAAANLWDAAGARGLSPANPAERLPFIEALAHLGRLDEAAALTAQSAAEPALLPALCAAWERAGQTPPAELNCP